MYTLTELFRKLDNWRQTSSTLWTSDDMSPKYVEKKKKLWRHNLSEITVQLLFKKMQKQLPEVFYKKVIKNFAIFTRKHLCWSLFLIHNITKSLRASIFKNICEKLLLKMCSWNWEQLNKNYWYGILTLPEAVVQRCFVKKVFLEIPQNSQENNCAGV